MKVIWVGLENAGSLVAAAKTLNFELSKLGFKREKRGFHPHITVARVKGPRKKNKVQQILKDYKDGLAESGVHQAEEERALHGRANLFNY
jgi:2'-5' RNA ligase